MDFASRRNPVFVQRSFDFDREGVVPVAGGVKRVEVSDVGGDEPRLFAQLAHGGGFDRFVVIDAASRKHVLPLGVRDQEHSSVSDQDTSRPVSERAGHELAPGAVSHKDPGWRIRAEAG